MAEGGDFVQDDGESAMLNSGYGVRGDSVGTLKRSRAGYLGYLTKLYGETQTLMLDKRNLDLVNDKLKVIFAAFANYERAHIAYMQRLEDREEIQKATLEFESRYHERFDFHRRVKEWMESCQLNVEIRANDVHPNDSISQQSSSASGSSRRSGSKASSRLSVKIKEAKVEKAIAKLRLQQLKRRFELQEKCDALLRQQELLDAENDIERASLRAQILEADDDVESVHVQKEKVQNVPSMEEEPSSNGKCHGKPTVAEDKATLVQQETEPTHVHVPLNPVDPDCVVKSSDREPNSVKKVDSPDGNLKQLFEQQQQLIHLQQRTFQSMASTIRQGFALPKPELNKFNGNPLEFWSFMRSFDNNIEKNTSDEGEKLTFLLQYCTGAAKDAIKSCVTMDPALGYQTARKLLKERFGHPFKIATAHLNQVTRGPPVKPNDQKGLLAFADQLKDCQNVLDSIGYLDEINSADNLRSIVDRLPFHLKTKWLEVADSIQESGQRPRIHHISKFVTDKARAANNPVFGGALNSDKDKDRGKKDRNNKKPSPSSTMGTTQATRGESGSSSSAVANDGVTENRQPSSRRRNVVSVKCLLCDGIHQLWNCEQFKRKSYDDRMKIIREAKLCDNCFKVGHLAKGCMQRSSCYVEGCNGKHMTIIHPPEQASSAGQRAYEMQTLVPPVDVSMSGNSHLFGGGPVFMPASESHASQNHAIGAGVRRADSNAMRTGGRVRLRIVPVKVQGNRPGEVVETYALLDNGSDVSLCDEKLIEELGITGVPRNFLLTTQEKRNSAKSGMEVQLTIDSINGESRLEIPKVWTVDRLNISEQSIPSNQDVDKWPHLNGIELPEFDNKDVRLLIGCNVPDAFWVLEERRGGKGEPVAIRSILGWTIIGPTERIDSEDSFNVNFIRLERKNDHDEILLQQVENFWKTEFTDSISSSKVAMSVEDERALKIMEESSKKVSGHYQIALPWRQQPPYLPNNRIVAEQRLHLLRKKFVRDQEFYTRYKGTINDYIVKGYAQRVPKEELSAEGKPLWYLPHHAVFHPHKPDKLRVVFDCAARYRGTSLNDQLLHGPDLTNSLFGVLVRFRQEPVALSSDIEAMFHQVNVDPKDYDALRFLWWPDDDLSKQPVEYRMVVHLFGSTSSPSCASFGLRKTAQDNAGEFDHEVIDTVLKNFYVDDCLKSVPSSEIAIKLREDLCELLSNGGFRLTKWSCNEKEVLDTIPTSERARSIVNLDLNADTLPIERTLGVQWNMETDMFIFKLAPKDKPRTRRGILSITSSIYDPLGMLSPVVLPAKKLLQELCTLKLGWDEEIEEEESQRWERWLADLPMLAQVGLPRCLKPITFEQYGYTELHHFADASQIAYGSVSYARLVNEMGQIHCSFLVGKSRLAHVKKMTIPRLELSAAVLAVKMDQTLREELELKIDKSIFWTDSTAVLQYIKNVDRRFHTFVANRLAVIHDGSDPFQWNYVPSSINPADDVSRGLTVEELLRNERWFKGPKFLWERETTWPSQSEFLPNISDEDPEVKKRGQAHHMTKWEETHLLDQMFQRYSSWYKLKRGVAWLLRFAKFIRKKKGSLLGCVDEPLCHGTLSVEELQSAEVRIIKYVQRSSFSSVIKALQDASSGEPKKHTLKNIGSLGSIYKLRPHLDPVGMLRVGGRLQSSPLDYQSKHQLLLPHKHHVTNLLIMDVHESVGHLGQEYVLTSVRQKFWIVKGRAAVRKVLSGCLTCRKQNSLRGQQIMGELPRDRLTPGDPPFSNVGIDYFGPLYVKQGRSTVKHYGCLFSCLTMRATHIEVAESLETDSFINALRRFISRRGMPKVIRSDNGTNLTGGEREIRESISNWNQQKIESYLHQKNIEWKFNPPGASHMGGVWERVIRSVRKILRVLLKEQLVSGEALRTLLAEVEGVLNNRPLTRNSDDPSDPEPLTPNHLLLLRSNLNMPPGVFVKADLYCQRRWRQVQYLADVFWKRWLSEYLPTLQERQKWVKPCRNFAIGDLVLVVDEKVHRSQWPVGRIVEVHPGRDGFIRSAKIVTKSTIFTRPITKLCFLEQENLNQVKDHT